MGRVGTSAYDKMRSLFGETVVGVDFDPTTVRKQRSTGRKVLLGDPSDADFWDRVAETHTIQLVMLALPNLKTNLSVLDQLEEARFVGRVAATARFPDEIETLKRGGAATVFDIYTEAGTGFAAHVAAETPD
jgi:Trk K+ transport system NAD-binding subunit